MVNKARIVIGANFGDEGKGLMSNYFSHQATRKGESCVTVLHNGGAQRGHTVEYPDGRRHIFKHFGSGSFDYVPTYLSKDFILNPIIFRQEWEELVEMGVTPVVYVNYKCRITTPYDMMLNQIVEANRGKNRHGSCGLGINETILRYKENLGKTLNDFIMFNDFTTAEKITLECQNAKIFLHERLKQFGIYDICNQWQEIINDYKIQIHYIEDFNFMLSKIKTVVEDNDFLRSYNTIVFEGGQGLMLDMDNKEYFPHLTPSHTGVYNPIKILKSMFNHSDDLKNLNIEVCYVTRSYITRHGAGRLDRECKKEEISSIINDKTNIPNPNQGVLRYGKLNIDELYNRIFSDFKRNIDIIENENISISIALTHLNEYNVQFHSEFKCPFSKLYHKLYYSYSPYGLEAVNSNK